MLLVRTLFFEKKNIDCKKNKESRMQLLRTLFFVKNNMDYKKQIKYDAINENAIFVKKKKTIWIVRKTNIVGCYY